MKLTFLGTGTSVGIPVIGCSCRVCLSSDPRNRRLRTSIWLQAGGVSIVVDTPADFREQALRYRIARVDAVLYTHSHADHIFGFDDLRRFNTLQKEILPVYAGAGTIDDLKRIFDYALRPAEMPGLYRPRVEFYEKDRPFTIGGIEITPVNVVHGLKPTLAYRFVHEGRTFGYAPDCKMLDDRALKIFEGVDIMVLDALRHVPHPTHLSVGESVAYLKRIAAKRSFLIHMCHEVDHEETQRALPESMELSYDGLTVEW